MPRKIRVPVAAKWDKEFQRMIPYIWEEKEVGKESKRTVGKTTKKERTGRNASKE